MADAVMGVLVANTRGEKEIQCEGDQQCRHHIPEQVRSEFLYRQGARG